MFEFHKDKQRYFEIQKEVTKQYIVPFLSNHLEIESNLRILEIGCGEGGVLDALSGSSNYCVGIELSSSRVQHANEFLHDKIDQGRIRIINKNIFDEDIMSVLGEPFDLILLKDVIEHLSDKKLFFKCLKNDLLKQNGKVFFAFPPWKMPFGGHQQICSNKILAKLPWYHLLPTNFYRSILKIGNEPQRTIEELLALKGTGLSMKTYSGLIKEAGFKEIEHIKWVINPIYKFKFGLRPRMAKLKFLPLREYFTTAVYSLLEIDSDKSI